MKPVFVDTSALIALGNARDHFHKQATTLLRELLRIMDEITYPKLSLRGVRDEAISL